MKVNYNVLEIKNLNIELSKQKEKILLVKDLSLSVEKGKVLGVVGESGSGKSMTCLAICGLLPDSIRIKSGEIYFNGARIDTIENEKKRKLRGNEISFILQNPISCFNPINSIESCFKETLLSHGFAYNNKNRNKIFDCLNEVGFDNPREIYKKFPFQLSGGMLQSLMISFALFFESSLIIADEPTTDIDPLSQAKIIETLDMVRKRRNCAIILVTHDLTVVSKLSDNVLIMKDGEACENGTFEWLIKNAEHEYSKKLFDAFHKLNSDYEKCYFGVNKWN